MIARAFSGSRSCSRSFEPSMSTNNANPLCRRLGPRRSSTTGSARRRPFHCPEQESSGTASENWRRGKRYFRCTEFGRDSRWCSITSTSLSGSNRLDDALLGAVGQRALLVLAAAEAGERQSDHFSFRDLMPNPANQFVAVDHRHPDVAQQDRSLDLSISESASSAEVAVLVCAQYCRRISANTSRESNSSLTTNIETPESFSGRPAV